MLSYALNILPFMFYNVKYVFLTLKQEFNSNYKVASPWDISWDKITPKHTGIHKYAFLCLQHHSFHVLQCKICNPNFETRI